MRSLTIVMGACSKHLAWKHYKTVMFGEWKPLWYRTRLLVLPVDEKCNPHRLPLYCCRPNGIPFHFVTLYNRDALTSATTVWTDDAKLVK